MKLIKSTLNASTLLTTFIGAGAVALAVTATSLPAHAQSSEDCSSMLTQAIGQRLATQGFDTSRVCDLTLNELVQIKALMDEDGMNQQARIQKILDGKE